jgi:hypothetical protein
VVVGITVQDADKENTSAKQQTLPEAAEQLAAVGAVTKHEWLTVVNSTLHCA